MEKKIRRLSDNLVTLGTGMLAFGVWTMIKTTLYCTLFRQEMMEGVELDGELPVWVYFLVVWIISLIDFFCLSYIGLSARSDGKGKRKTFFYLILLFLRVLLFGGVVVIEITSFFKFQTGLLSSIITLFIDVTSLIFMADLAVSSIHLRILRRRQKREVPHES